MKKSFVALALVLAFSVGVPAYAFVPAEGGSTLATEQHLVVRDYNGMRVYEVSFNPQTPEQRSILSTWIGARAIDLLRELNGLGISFKTEPQQDRIADLESRIAQIDATVKARGGDTNSFSPFHDGKRNVAGENENGKFLVKAGHVIYVNEASAEYIEWLLTLRWGLHTELNSIPRVDNSESEQALANSGIAGRIQALVSMASVLGVK